MRKSQWFVLGLGFFILGMLLASISLQASSLCDYSSKNLIPCVRQQVFAVFPYIFFLLGVVCYVNGYIEWWHEKRKK